MEFEYHVKGSATPTSKINANASANIRHIIGKSDVYLHPSKCPNCNKYFPEMIDQTIEGLNHEVQESLVCDILMREKGFYKNEWFDKTSQKMNPSSFVHSCKKWWQRSTRTSTLFTSSYIR